ncbi:hypothetical protein KFU94_16290 [Chloroflexi bacterium TSY]|nr:hypothetical protein [Chloroflexi bacterium TSY]
MRIERKGLKMRSRSWWSFRYGSWDISGGKKKWSGKGMGGKKVRRVPSEKHRYHRVLATEAARESEPTL